MNLRSLSHTLIGVCLTLFAFSRPAMGITDYVFFSVNGDSSVTTMVQGDTVSWGANCEVGGSLFWEIWFDIDGNGVIDDPGDAMVVSFGVTDGDMIGNDGPPDSNPIPDGWYIVPPMILGVAPGDYVFRATNSVDSTTAERAMSCTEMPSPPNTFSGHLIVPGHPAPDPAILQYHWVEAEGGPSKNQIWTGMTNDSGRFQINVGSEGTGQTFEIWPPDIPGFVTPMAVTLPASGHTANVDFEYAAPTDSVWGYVLDQDSVVITTPVNLWCGPMFGQGGKDAQTVNGRYLFLFSPSELGQWSIGWGEGLVPTYMLPARFEFDNSIQSDIRHDFVCPTADTVMYAKVTENGNPPTHQYRVNVFQEPSGTGTFAVSDIGAGNVATLHISKLYNDGYGASIDVWSDDYPIPPGYVVESNPGPNFQPGDTVDLNLINGFMIRDTVKVAPGDPPISWNGIMWVSVWSPTFNASTSPGSDGVYTLYAPAGSYSLNANFMGGFVNPGYYDIVVTGDTIGGLGFTVNQSHCRIHGALTNLSLPLGQTWNVFAHNTDGYYFGWMVDVDSVTGTYEMNLCDGNWTIQAPTIPGYVTPDDVNLTIGNSPDTAREIDLAYMLISGVGEQSGHSSPTVFEVEQNYPNPFNPTTTIAYAVPKASHVKIEVYNLIGQTVRTLIDEERTAGTYRTEWDGRDISGNSVPSGIYLYRFRAGDMSETKKMLLLK